MKYIRLGKCTFAQFEDMCRENKLRVSEALSGGDRGHRVKAAYVDGKHTLMCDNIHFGILLAGH